MVNKNQKNKPETRQWSLINQTKMKTNKKITITTSTILKEHTAALRSNWPIEQQNFTETNNQQHDEILSNKHDARNTTNTRSNTSTINSQEEQPKNLKYATIQPNGNGNSNQILAELTRGMQQVIMATENLRKRFDQMLKLN